MLFFTSVGFQTDIKVIRTGGKPLLVMILLVAGLITIQNLISVGVSHGLGLSSIFGMAAGSIPMCGGHGTAGGFSPLLEQMGLSSAQSITMASATFGLIAGSLLGGPLAESLIRRHHLAEPSADEDMVKALETEQVAAEKKSGLGMEGDLFKEFLSGACMLIIAMALGSGLSRLLRMTGIAFPTYFGALLAAIVLRNTLGLSPKISQKMCVDRIVSIGNICLQLFLGMAMASLRLWELASMALPLTLILVLQVCFMVLYALFVAFPMLGKSYDSAVLVSGLCGFGLGATPNAMANMSAVCYKYRYAVKPFVIVPIIGGMFVDIINTGIITLFLNIVH